MKNFQNSNHSWRKISLKGLLLGLLLVGVFLGTSDAVAYITVIIAIAFILFLLITFISFHSDLSILDILCSPYRRSNSTPSGRVTEDFTPAQYEEMTAWYLQHNGYDTAEVTPASGDFGADVLAEKWGKGKLAVQCKRYKGSVGVRAVEEVIAAKAYYHCTEAAVFTTGTYTQAAIRMANETGVQLYQFDGKYCRKL